MSEIMRIMNEIKNEGKDISYDQLKTRLEEIAPTQEQFDNLLELLDFVYYIGIEEGDSMGYKNALTDNNLSGDEEERVFNDGYEQGMEEAREDMRRDQDTISEESWDNGYNEGWDSGKQDGYEDGYENGKQDGYEDGKCDGYEEGYKDGVESIS